MQILQSLNPFDLERLEEGDIRSLTGKFSSSGNHRLVILALHFFLKRFFRAFKAPHG